MNIETVVVGPFQCNCRILVCPKTGDTVIVDPGDEPSKILERVRSLGNKIGVKPKIRCLFHTHGHLDHIAGTRMIRESESGASASIWLHPGDKELYLALKVQSQMFGLNYGDPLAPEYFMSDNETFKVGEMDFEILHTPGHSPGSVCLKLKQDTALKTPEALLSGDTLFKGSVGRTDLWGGDQSLMFNKIRERILTLDDDTLLWPGHGPNSKVGIEKRENPFLI